MGDSKPPGVYTSGPGASIQRWCASRFGRDFAPNDDDDDTLAMVPLAERGLTRHREAPAPARHGPIEASRRPTG